MNAWTRLAGCLAAWLLLGSPSPGQMSYPMLLDLSPVAVQVGTTTECEVSSKYNLAGAYQVLVSGSGVTAEAILPEEKPQPASTEGKPAEPPAKQPDLLKLKLRFIVAADALPGVRDFRIATPQGVSTLGQVVVVLDPVQVEKNPNDTLDKATPLTLPATACGTIEKAEDVDFFKFRVDRPQALSFHLRCQRLQDRIHDLQAHADPLIALRNESGSVLALNDNFFYADPYLHYEFQQPGEYFLEIRDVRYTGNSNWQYCVEIHDRPFLTNVHPLAVQPGQTVDFELVGFGLPTQRRVKATVPVDAPLGRMWLPLGLSPASNPAPIVVQDLSLIPEAAQHQTPAEGQMLNAPAAVSGRLGASGEVDYYRFTATKGEKFTIEVVARRHQSALDPIIGILNDKGARVTENDDGTDGRLATADSLLEAWTAPADGTYDIELRDLHLRGGAEFVYLLKLTRAEPFFTLWLDSDKSVVTPGTGATIYVRAQRKNGFTGEIALSIEGLPPGVTASCGRILDGQTDGCIILQAAADAQLAVGQVRVRGSASVGDGESKTTLNVEAEPYQETYLPGGGRGLYYAPWHTVSIARPMDLTAVRIEPATITLKPGESVKIDVRIERAPGFDKNVTLDVMYRHLNQVSGNSLPPGITIDEKNSKTLLTGSATEGYITLKADPTAKPVENQLLPVFAHVAINFVMKMSYASEPISVTIAAP